MIWKWGRGVTRMPRIDIRLQLLQDRVAAPKSDLDSGKLCGHNLLNLRNAALLGRVQGFKAAIRIGAVGQDVGPKDLELLNEPTTASEARLHSGQPALNGEEPCVAPIMAMVPL